MFFFLFCFDFFVGFFSRAAGSTGDEEVSVFPKVELGYASDCLACICGKTLSNSTASSLFFNCYVTF